MLRSNFTAALLAAGITALANYPINYPADQTVAANGRCLTAIALNTQQVPVGQSATNRQLYWDLHDTAIFTATSGSEVLPKLVWSGSSMHGYLYIDLNQDGQFDPTTELLSYSCLNQKNSLDATVAYNVGVTLPSLTLPEMEPGDYRMRYLVDWNWNDPGGRASETNKITNNGGAIVDATLRIVPSEFYTVNYPPLTTVTHASRRLTAINVACAGLDAQTVTVGQNSDNLLYHNFTLNPAINLVAGQPVNISYTSNITWMNSYVYIDLDGDGQFTLDLNEQGVPTAQSDLVAYSNRGRVNSLGETLPNGNVLTPPTFTLPASLPAGNYRMRVKIDWDNTDPAGNNSSTNSIITNGGSITDFTVCVSTPVKVAPYALNSLILAANGSPLPETTMANMPLTIKVLPTLPGFEAAKVVVRNAKGDHELDIENSLVTIPAELLSGDIKIYSIFNETSDSEWTKVWGDEFSGSSLDTRRWAYHPRMNATWNRFVAQGAQEQARVNVIADGYYNSYCIATPAEFTSETKEMISGAIYSYKKFDFTHGKIEARIRTTPHTGNFPAFWLMPTNAKTWPSTGEIDIWEQIDAIDKSHHTIHSGWTGYKSLNWTAPTTASPTSTFAVAGDASQWHVYALEWDADQLRWYVDGTQVFAYTNQHYSEAGTNYTEAVTWPFNAPFYIILNQSVGSGAWAKEPDTSFTYHTRFDYVRVYQKKDAKSHSSSLSDNGDDPEFFKPITPASITTITDDSTPAAYYNLSGQRISSPQGLCIERRGSQSRIIKL